MAAKKKRTPRKATARKKSTAKKAPPDAAAYLKRLQANSSEGVSFSMFSDELALPPVAERIPTGSIALDRLTGGGWPVGRLSECAAWEHIGKSTLLDQSIGEAQRLGDIGSLIDSERARDPAYTVRLGVDPTRLLMSDVETIEDSFVAVDRMIDLQMAALAEYGSMRRMLLVLDALGGTPARAELQGDPDDQHMMVAARTIGMNFRRLLPRLAKARIAMVFANHFYARPNIPGLVTYGGKGPRYFTSLRVWLKKPQNAYIKLGERIVGHKVEASPKKSRVSSQRQPVTLGLLYGYGFSNAYTLYEWGHAAANAEGNAWIHKGPQVSYVYPPGEAPIGFRQRWLGFGELLQERPELYLDMVTQYLNEEAV